MATLASARAALALAADRRHSLLLLAALLLLGQFALAFFLFQRFLQADFALRDSLFHRLAPVDLAQPRLHFRKQHANTGGVAADELLGHLGREGLSKYDMPEFFVRLEEFPLTASGKILKRNLVEMVKRGELAPVPVRFQQTEGAA